MGSDTVKVFIVFEAKAVHVDSILSFQWGNSPPEGEANFTSATEIFCLTAPIILNFKDSLNQIMVRSQISIQANIDMCSLFNTRILTHVIYYLRKWS